MSYEMGALAEPLTIALHGIHRGGLKAGEDAAIRGRPIPSALCGMAVRPTPDMYEIIDIGRLAWSPAKRRH